MKPQNVLLNGDGEAKVTDFGIARSLDVEGVTQTGTVLGTSNYIAPEQASGLPVDAQTDVYSLGVVLFELLTGEVPFSGESFVAVAMQHVNEPPPSVLELRPEVPLRRRGRGRARARRRRPEDRFPTMDAFVAELETCLGRARRRGPTEDATAIVPARSCGRARRGGARGRARRRVVAARSLLLGSGSRAGRGRRRSC